MMIPDKQGAATAVALIPPARLPKGGFVPFPSALFTDAWKALCASADVRLSRTDKWVALVLLGFLPKGKTWVAPHEDTLALTADLSERHLRRSLRNLEAARAIRTTARRGQGGAFLGNRYDLSGLLRLLPARWLKAVGLASLLRQSEAVSERPPMSGGENTPTAVPPTPGSAPAEPGKPAPEGANPHGDHRTPTADPEQSHAVREEQHTAPAGGETGPERPRTEGQVVVDRLCKEWKENGGGTSRLSRSQAWLCYKLRGAETCLAHVEALERGDWKPRRNHAGFLRNSLLLGYELPASYVAFKNKPPRPRGVPPMFITHRCASPAPRARPHRPPPCPPSGRSPGSARWSGWRPG